MKRPENDIQPPHSIFAPPGVDQTERLNTVAPVSDTPTTEFSAVSKADPPASKRGPVSPEPLPLTQRTGPQVPIEETTPPVVESPIQVPDYRFPKVTRWTRRRVLTTHLHDEHDLPWLKAEGIEPDGRYRNKGYLVDLHRKKHEGITGHRHGNGHPQTNPESSPGAEMPFANALPKPRTRLRQSKKWRI